MPLQYALTEYRSDKEKLLALFDALVSLQPSLTVDGVSLTQQDIQDLLNQTEGLALLKGKWIEVNHEKLKKLLEDMKNVPENLSFREAMRLEIADRGKFELLKELCETIYEKRERVIVFTQFKEITEYLADYLTGMKNYWDDGELYSQPSKSLLKRNASDSLKKQKMKGKAMHPILISGRKIARSWWGNAWCENLEGYADYASRLERGKRYVRNGTVVDLQIEMGRIQARVQGRRKAPDGCHIFRL